MTETPNIPFPNVLVVDDDRYDRELTATALRETHKVGSLVTLDGGGRALDFLTGPAAPAQAENRPDLVVLDLNMPGVDGLEVLRRIKAHPDLRHLSVVVLTSSYDDQDRERCLASGADEFLNKPNSFLELLDLASQVADSWLARREASAG